MIETTKMSSRGQIVIPQSIREMIHADEGTLFSVMGTNDTIILKKIETPSREELIKQLKEVTRENTKRLKARGFTERDILAAAERERARKKD